MTDNLHLVKVPQLGVNDQSALLVVWSVREEQFVHAGDVICELETTKATMAVEAPASGHIVFLAKEGEELPIGRPLALIGPHKDRLNSEKQKQQLQQLPTEESAKGKYRTTQKAQKLAESLGVNLSEVRPQSGAIIREADVRRYAEKPRSNGGAVERPVHLELGGRPARTPVAIYGAGKGAITMKECLDAASKYFVACFLDDASGMQDQLCGLSVYNGTQQQDVIVAGVTRIAIAVADGATRMRLAEQSLAMGMEVISVIHPRTQIAPSARLGKGVFVKAGAIIETNTIVEDYCIIDNGAIIAHDNHVMRACHIAPGAALGSGITIGERVIVGIGAAIATGVTVGRGSIISVGSAVTMDVPDFSVVEGVPGKLIGKRKKRD